jgi:hypothetical protein
MASKVYYGFWEVFWGIAPQQEPVRFRGGSPPPVLLEV